MNAIEILFVTRDGPRSPVRSPREFFWTALRMSGLARGAEPSNPVDLPPLGMMIIPMHLSRGRSREIDAEIAGESARAQLASEVDRVRGAVEDVRPRIVAFLGNALYFAALGESLDPADFESADGEDAFDRSERTFRARANFGGAAAVALPSVSRWTPEPLVLERYKSLAALRTQYSSGEDAR